MPASESLFSSGCRKSSGMSRVLPATLPSGTLFRIVLSPSNWSATDALPSGTACTAKAPASKASF